jgi:hypothetical protein
MVAVGNSAAARALCGQRFRAKDYSMHPLRRILIWLALASPISKVTLFCLDLALRHWQHAVQRRI